MPIARAWREYPHRYRYEAAVCDGCGKWHFPRRTVCDKCRGEKFSTKTMRRTGKILTWTIIRVPPGPFKDQTPYALAVVEMDDGPRVTTQIADWREGEFQIGQRVQLEFRRITQDGAGGVINYGFKAVTI
ncbi:MAG: Zn-ribbon domain-containing OB-fold protein [Pseudomonadota bacterium]